MDSKEVQLLKKALNRQKKARQQAEKILEEKSKELYDQNMQLKQANTKLEGLLKNKNSKFEGVFHNIIDPYVVMDLYSNVIDMNDAAKEFLQFDHTKENISLIQFVHPDYLQYTQEAFVSLAQVGILKNYRAKIVLPDKSEKYIQINSSLIFDKGKPIGAHGIIRDISKETEIKNLLADQKQQLNIIVDSSPLGIVLLINDAIVKANQSFCMMLGYTEKELKNLKIEEFVSMQETVSTDLPYMVEHQDVDNYTVIRKYVCKSGDTLLAKTNVSEVKNDKGKIEFKVAIVEDITKELEAADQLRSSETRLSTLILNLQTGVLLEDENRKIALTNQLFLDLFNIPGTPDQLIGEDCSSSATLNKKFFKDPEGFTARIQQILAERKVVMSQEFKMVDGRILELDYIPIYTNNEYNGHLWTYQDVTISKNYEQNLKAQREKYSSIIANMNLGMVEVDTNDIVQMVNQSFCKMSGFSENELMNRVASTMIHVKSKDVQKNIEIEDKHHLVEVEAKTKNGEIRYWLLSGAPRYDDTGNIIGSIGIYLDVTEQKDLELQKEKLLEELESSNQGLKEYAHIVSHDLKSPLRSVSALATWLSEDYMDVLDDGGKFNLQQIQEKIEGMDRLINGILKYSSIKNESEVRVKVDLNKVIDDITHIIYIPEHVKVTKTTLPVINADKTKIHQLFQNLISNAVTHIDNEEGLVVIGATETPTHWQFSIQDNGVGIPKEYHEKIFKIFQSISKNQGSTGIGLSIVKKIVDLYEGEIWLDSEIDKGTTFYFTLKK